VPLGFQQVEVGVEGAVGPVGDREGIIAGGGVEPVAGDGGEQSDSAGEVGFVGADLALLKSLDF